MVNINRVVDLNIEIEEKLGEKQTFDYYMKEILGASTMDEDIEFIVGVGDNGVLLGSF